MKVFAHNFDPSSNSGPNKFSRQLFMNLMQDEKYSMTSQQEEADVEFCLIQQSVHKKKPMLLRLDGIYFNSEQDFKQQNAPINFAYENADTVVFQSEFNKALTEHWFGEHKNNHVIHNAYFGERIKDETFRIQLGDREIWSCASSWRPHKRLIDNVRYFLKWAPESSVFMIAGLGYTKEEKSKIQLLLSENNFKDKKIIMLGDLNYCELRQLYDASSTFVHLAYLDHCPNVVVDAYAHGCQIICTDSGGTNEISWSCKLVAEKHWDFSPIPLYNPPELDLENIIDQHFSHPPNIEKLAENCLEKYKKAFEQIQQ